MTASISWVHIGDLHMDEADGWVSRERLERIVAEVNGQVGAAADFVFLPGDNANHATAAQYRAITDALAPLRLPWRVIPGDHDFEGGDLARYDAAFARSNRPEVEVIAGHRCVFLDIISKGAGGPDFRLTMHHRHRLLEELARAEAEGQAPLVFMHAYPGDLAADGDAIARTFADARVAFVDTGHTHYNELLNDGRVVYGATRSTAQIEEGGGVPGYALVTVHGGVPSWRFKEIGSGWPFVQIVAPADLRLVTRAGLATAVGICILIRGSPVELIRGVSWSVLPLVAGLFVLVEALDRTGVIGQVATTLRSVAADPARGALLSGTTLAFVSNLMNNLPAGLVASTAVAQAHPPKLIVDALLIGVDLGPNLSITGSLATILWLQAIRREGEDVGFWRFLKVGTSTMVPALAASLGARLLIG